jgi:spore photoproduct lyase
MASAGYPVGITVAPLMPLPGWQDDYGSLLGRVAGAVSGVPGCDLTVELITHRFTEASKAVLLNWYPQTKLDLDESARARKRTKFGGVKYVYPTPVMRTVRDWFERELARQLPDAQLLYWT